MNEYYEALGLRPWTLRQEKTQLMVIAKPMTSDAAEKTFAGMLKVLNLTRDEIHFVTLDPLSSAEMLSQQITQTAPSFLLIMGKDTSEEIINALQLLNIPMIITFHPEHLLLNAQDKREAFEDLKITAQKI